MRNRLDILMLGVLLVLCACQAPRPYAAAPPEDAAGIDRNHGYALLYSTLESEARVDQALLIKQPRQEVRDLLRDIGGFARDSRDQLATLAERDATLGFDEHGLPYAEAQTRDLITRTTSRQVVASTGRSFEFHILLTQHEALNYIVHLAEALKAIDQDENRRALLNEIATDARDLHDRVIDLLRDAYIDSR